MENKLLFILCLILYFTGITNAQQTTAPERKNYTIKGIVLDGMDKQPVELATVALFNAKDSTLVQGDMTEENGTFELTNVPDGSYYLTISFIGYESTLLEIPQTNLSSPITNLDKLYLNSAGFELGEVEIVATLPEVVMRGDTTQYNAEAYQLDENAPLEDLLAQLPGMEVDEDGEVTSNAGTKVTRIFIDGEEMFADEPEWVLKNWPAYLVDKIEIYERKSEQAMLTGVDDGIRETVINITTKKEMKLDMVVGDIQGGAGTLFSPGDENAIRYTGNATVTRTTDKDKYTVRANINNVNNRPLNRLGGRLGGRGINRMNSYGINIQQNANKQLKILGDLSYKNDNRETNQQTFRENIFPDSVSYRNTTSSNLNNNHNLFFRSTIEYRPDTATTLIFKPEISFNRSDTENSRTQITRAGDLDSSLVNSSNSLNRLHADDYNVRLHFDLSRLLSEKGRRATLSGSFRTNGRNGTERKEAENIYYRSPEDNILENQQTLINNNRNVYYMNVAYVEPIAKGHFINFSYTVEYSKTDNKNKTFDYEPEKEEYTTLNDKYSRNSESEHLWQAARLNFTGDREKYHYNIGLQASPNRRSSKTYIKDWNGAGNDSILNDLPVTNDINYAPQVNLIYRFRNDTVRTNLHFRYNGRTEQPSIWQLDPTPNNNDPLRISSGNPNLSAFFIHNMFLEFNENNIVGLRNFKATLAYNFTQNQIIDFVIYDPETGVEYRQPINRNGAWDGALNVFYTKPVDKKQRVKFTSQSRIFLRNQLGYTNVENQSVENDSRYTELVETLSMNHKVDNFRNDVKFTFRYSETHFTLRKENRREAFNFDIFYKPFVKFDETWSASSEFFFRSARTYYSVNDNTMKDREFVWKPILRMPYDWVISNEFRYLARRGMTEGYDTTENIWNIVVSKQILNKKGTILLQLNDILQESKNINRNIGNDFYEDTRYNALTSYFMVSFNYHLNEMIGNKTKNKPNI